MNQRRKGAATSAILAVLGVVVVGGVIWYFVSDPFRTRANEAFKQGTTWTPEQIAKDPAMYLSYVEEETLKAKEKLKASKIAIAQNQAQLEKMRDDSRHQVDVGKKAVAELVGAFKAAEPAAQTISWNGKDMKVADVKTQVVALDKQVQQKQNLLTKVESGLKSLDVQRGKIAEAEANADSQLAEIRTNKELLKVQAVTDDIKNKLVNMQGAVAATVNAATETGTVVSLDQLAAQSQVQADNTDFEKVLANYQK